MGTERHTPQPDTDAKPALHRRGQTKSRRCDATGRRHLGAPSSHARRRSQVHYPHRSEIYRYGESRISVNLAETSICVICTDMCTEGTICHNVFVTGYFPYQYYRYGKRNPIRTREGRLLTERDNIGCRSDHGIILVCMPACLARLPVYSQEHSRC